MQSEISAGLKRLVMSPRRLSGVSLWNALSPREREAAARAYLGSAPAGRRHLNGIVAEARNLRPATVFKWPEAKIVAAMRSVPLPDPAVAVGLLQSHHVPGQLPMVTGFLDALGVRHEDGRVESIEQVDASDEVVRTAAERIAEDYGLQTAAVYLLVLRLWRAPAGEKGRVWLQTLLATPPERADSELEEPPEAVAEPSAALSGEEREAEQDDPTRQRSFTTLDRLLILAAVDTAQGIEGALSEDELDDVVDELLKLNGRRHQSYFHAGFRDVLLDRAVAEELPAENQGRLRWYWTGAIQGWARRKQWDCIVREYAKTPVVKDLGSGSDSPSVAAVQHVVEALRQQDRTIEIAPFVKVEAVVGQPRLFIMLLDAATKLLREGDAGSALPIFELLMEASRTLEERGVSPPERLLLDVHRRMAHCLRQLHEHARARDLLEHLLREDPDPNIRAMVHADLGLMVGGFDGLEEVALPLRHDELDGAMSRLAEGAEHFRESVKVKTSYSAHGHYCLGVLALGRAVNDGVFEGAERHLQRARVYFSEAAGTYPQELVQRASLYFGIAKAQQLSSHKLAHAADVTTKALRSGARFPPYLIDQTVEAFGLADDKADLRRVTDAIIETGGDAVLDALATCEAALDHCSGLCDKLLSRATSKNRAGSARAADLRSALRGFLNRSDLEAAGEALDALEKLARSRVAVPAFLELMKDRTRYEPAWDIDDASIARACCHEARGEFLDALTVLQDLFYRLASSEREGGLGDAAGVLHRIRGYGIDSSIYSDMTRRFDALAARETDAIPAGDVEAGRQVRVLVVGGAEQQARAEEMARRKLEEHYPRIRASFIRTGWHGNWNRTFADIQREMPRHDALVIVRFMRTHLGRKIRQHWSGPWRFCWSGGPGAIVEAVASAAAAVR